MLYLGFALLFLWAPPQDRFAADREAMVRDQIQGRGVRNAAVLSSMRSVPRHELVPDAIRHMAYSDRPLPIGHGQTISQPYIVALMTELLEPTKSDRVLEIGTGSGYQAAVLSSLVKEVYTIELEAPLAEQSTAKLRELGYSNVIVRHGDGYLGWPDKAPFDKIILTAAPPKIPQALIDQLKPGGILVAPEGRMYQELIVITKDRNGRAKRRTVIPVMFVPMRPGERK
jgi:protein-L-isoaspartate(D-aspartate) O-methyltransferase